MLTKRWKEEIYQTVLEMKSFIESLVAIHSELQDSLAIQNAIIESMSNTSDNSKDDLQVNSF